jgi:hypothetical protein
MKKFVRYHLTHWPDLQWSLGRLSKSLAHSLAKELLISEDGDTYLLSEILAVPDELAKLCKVRFPRKKPESFYSVIELLQTYRDKQSSSEAACHDLILNRKLAEILESLQSKPAVLSSI